MESTAIKKNITLIHTEKAAEPTAFNLTKPINFLRKDWFTF